MAALSEEQKVARDASIIAQMVQVGDDWRVFDSDGRDPSALASAVQSLVGHVFFLA